MNSFRCIHFISFRIIVNFVLLRCVSFRHLVYFVALRNISFRFVSFRFVSCVSISIRSLVQPGPHRKNMKSFRFGANLDVNAKEYGVHVVSSSASAFYCCRFSSFAQHESNTMTAL